MSAQAGRVEVLVVYYSMYGNTYRMAQTVADGVREIEQAEATIKTVPELISDEVIQANEAMKAAKTLQKNVPMATVDDLAAADAIIVGSPTRFGNMCAQMRNFWDRTTSLWMKGALIGKPAGVFCSTASLHGGQETTLVSMMLTLLHHGMIVVGVPYSVRSLSRRRRAAPPMDRPTPQGQKASCR